MLKYILVENDTQKQLAKELVENYHSYVPTYRSIGRRIDWLIYDEDELIGLIGIGSATYPPCKDVLRYLNISKQEYAKIFNSFANNWRFCMKKKIHNACTQILKYVRNNAPIIWKQKYGDDLKYLVTFVGGVITERAI